MTPTIRASDNFQMLAFQWKSSSQKFNKIIKGWLEESIENLGALVWNFKEVD